MPAVNHRLFEKGGSAGHEYGTGLHTHGEECARGEKPGSGRTNLDRRFCIYQLRRIVSDHERENAEASGHASRRSKTRFILSRSGHRYPGSTHGVCEEVWGGPESMAVPDWQQGVSFPAVKGWIQ